MSEWIEFKVGAVHSHFQTFDNSFLMEYTDSGFVLYCRLSGGITHSEKQAYKADSSFDIVFTEKNSIGFFGVKFGNMPWSDCPFIPNLYNPVPVFNKLDDNKGYALNVVLIDSSKGEILGLRVVGLGHDFSVAIKEWCENALVNLKITREQYLKAVDVVYAQHTTVDLIAQPLASWKL